MLAAVGHHAPFERSCQQTKLLAGVEMTAKEVERAEEAVGEDIGARQQQEVQRTLQRDRPGARGDVIPILYVQMGGTGVSVVKKEAAGRQGKTEGQPAHAREAQLGCVLTQTKRDDECYPLRDPDSIIYTGAFETAEPFGTRLSLEAWKRDWSRSVQGSFKPDARP